MKKILFALLATIALFGCKPSATTQSEAPEDQKTTLVTYFSATGTTEAVAQLLAQAANADLLEIEPAEAYTDADLNWRDSLSRSSVEMRDPASRPELKAAPESLQQYDTVFIGFPIWWGVAPHVVNSFIEAADLQGKTVIPFATSGGSMIDPATEALRAAYPALNIADGRLLNDITFEDLSAWIEELSE